MYTSLEQKKMIKDEFKDQEIYLRHYLLSIIIHSLTCISNIQYRYVGIVTGIFFKRVFNGKRMSALHKFLKYSYYFF